MSIKRSQTCFIEKPISTTWPRRWSIIIIFSLAHLNDDCCQLFPGEIFTWLSFSIAPLTLLIHTHTHTRTHSHTHSRKTTTLLPPFFADKSWHGQTTRGLLVNYVTPWPSRCFKFQKKNFENLPKYGKQNCWPHPTQHHRSWLQKRIEQVIKLEVHLNLISRSYTREIFTLNAECLKTK